MADKGLEGAIRLVQEGKSKEAHELLEKIVKTDVRNVDAWLWYANTSSSARERTRILEACLRFNPDDLNTRRMLGLAPSPQHSAATNPPQSAPNSLSFTTPSSPAPLAESSESTKPLKAYVPTPPAPGRAVAPKNSRAPIWLLLGSASMFIIFVAAAGWMVYRSMPVDASKYRHTGSVDYYLYVPSGYTGDRQWPLFIGIHGSGGTGLDCWNSWQSYADSEGFVLLCPSLADAGGGWYQDAGEVKLFSAMEQARSQYRLGSQEFLAGFSAGAQFVQGFAFAHPQYVSGIAIISSGNYYPPGSAPRIPMLVVIGDRDDPGAVSTAADFSSRLKQAGFDINYVVLPGVGHTLTNRAQQLTIELFRKTQGE